VRFLNLPLERLRSDEVLGAEPEDRGTWLNLLCYCADQENGGRIRGAREWSDRKWIQVTGVLRADLDRECALWSWDRGTLVVRGYPVEQERVVRAKRRGGRNRGSGPSAEATAEESSEESMQESSEESRLRNRNRNRKRKEKKAKTARAPAGELSLIEGSPEYGVRDDTPPTVEQVVAGAEQLGVSEEYARWWFEQMALREWRDSGRRPVAWRWRQYLKVWHEKDRGTVPAAESADAPDWERALLG